MERRAPQLAVRPPRAAPGQPRAPAVGFVGTYPPTVCGVATFNLALRRAIGAPRSAVVACADAEGITRQLPEVVAELVPGSTRSLGRAAAALADVDAVVLQHEFGIYGGADGREVLDLAERIEPPLIVVLHTVVRVPSRHQRAIVERLAEHAYVVVAQSGAARLALLNEHDVPAAKVRVIPHGARRNIDHDAPAPRRPVILTWGLLGRDKGIETAIEAVAGLRDLDPPPLYIVRGRTHPRVLEHEGERYRHSLQARVRALGAGDLVQFDDRYLDEEAVLAGIRAAAIVLLPYRSRDQVVSGVLVEALASGKPVVSTAFPHAVELLSEGSGLLVPHDDAAAMEAALRTLLTDPVAAAEARRVAARQAARLSWRSVGHSYRELLAAAVGSRR